MLHDLLALRGIGFDQIHGEAVSSVVPRLVSEYRHMFERYLEREALIVGPGTKTGMPILLENPHELGPDRLVNAVAGYDLCGDACVIVDFGTAINYDVVSRCRRVPGRDHRARDRDLDRGPHLPRRTPHQGRHRGAAAR